MKTKTKQKRGFALLSKEKRSKIARMGGKASHGGGRKVTKKNAR